MIAVRRKRDRWRSFSSIFDEEIARKRVNIIRIFEK